jgi:antitoxin component of MazEF toxin-antitoxin module
MRKFLERIGDVKEAITLRVCKAGEGYCIYIPKKVVDTYDIRPGDHVKVELRDHFREKVEE